MEFSMPCNPLRYPKVRSDLSADSDMRERESGFAAEWKLDTMGMGRGNGRKGRGHLPSAIR